MPCRLDDHNVPVYQTASSDLLLELGPSGGVFARAERQRDRSPYKRYLSPCKRQRDWQQVRRRLTEIRDAATRETDRERSAQLQYDADALTNRLPAMVRRLHQFKGVNNRRIFTHLAARIEALDDQAKVSLTPWLGASSLVTARDIRKAISSHPSLLRDKKNLEALLDTLETHRVQIDFVRGEDTTSCPRLAITSGTNERFDIDASAFVPAHTLLIRLFESNSRHACIPWQYLREGVESVDVIDYPGEWVKRRGEYVEGRGRGEPFGARTQLFPLSNNAYLHQPFQTPIIRLQRLLRRQ